MKSSNQSGFTLTELMITIALGMSVISSVLLGYLATYTSSMNTMAASRLNQELGTLMSVMVSDLRRAGYTSDFDSADFPADNAFGVVDSTGLEIFDSMASNTQQAATGSGTCIVYSYDRDEDGVVDVDELSGFRLNTGVVQMRTSGNAADPDTCATTNNTWVDLTDDSFVTVSALTFNLADSQCLNTREPNTIDDDTDGTVDNMEEYDCYETAPVAASGDITVETRQITITVTGNLNTDAFVRTSLTQNVRVRNDWVRVR
jgi:prepilin peptidase dependent protein B